MRIKKLSGIGWAFSLGIRLVAIGISIYDNIIYFHTNELTYMLGSIWWLAMFIAFKIDDLRDM